MENKRQAYRCQQEPEKLQRSGRYWIASFTFIRIGLDDDVCADDLKFFLCAVHYLTTSRAMSI
jgi:hypothetical protein